MNSSTRNNKEKSGITVREMTVFAMLGVLMYGSKVLMEALPNIHLLGLFIMTFTVVFRKKALIPLYVYVFLEGLLSGFGTWWIPYLYVWTVLWGATMLLPRRMPKKIAYFVYPLVGFLYGLSFGTLYAPVQALLFRMDFAQMTAWIVAGLPWDLLHAVGNLASCVLVVPLSELMRKLVKA